MKSYKINGFKKTNSINNEKYYEYSDEDDEINIKTVYNSKLDESSSDEDDENNDQINRCIKTIYNSNLDESSSDEDDENSDQINECIKIENKNKQSNENNATLSTLMYHKIMNNLNIVLEKAIKSNNEETINNTVKLMNTLATNQTKNAT